MIRAILIDDEPLALMYLDKLLKELPQVEVAGTYTSPIEAMGQLDGIGPNVVFLDIDMPDMNGLRAAEMIQEQYPEMEIVFVTAYNEFALKAFEINALDYVLKPLQRKRLASTVERLEKRLVRMASRKPQRSSRMLHAFGFLQYSDGEEAPQPFRWRTAKTEELLAYLLHHRNKVVYKEVLIDLLWPNSDVKKASTHLYTTIYQLRKALRLAGIEVTINKISGKEGYCLSTDHAKIDVDDWEKGIQVAGDVRLENVEVHQSLLNRYTSDYLGDYGFIWAEGERQRLRTIWLHHAGRVADFYLNNNMMVSAASVYQRVVKLQPYSEEGHLGLMKVYQRMGEFALVEEQYAIICQIYKEELGVKVADSIQHWYREWSRSRR